MYCFRAIVIAAAIVSATGPALAGKSSVKQVTTQTSNDPKLHHVIGHVTALGVGQPPSGEPAYLNIETHNVAQRPKVSLEGGEPTPYGFPSPDYPDDQIGFYKSGYEAYENSPLDGYYSWSGHISP